MAGELKCVTGMVTLTDEERVDPSLPRKSFGVRLSLLSGRGLFRHISGLRYCCNPFGLQQYHFVDLHKTVWPGCDVRLRRSHMILRLHSLSSPCIGSRCLEIAPTPCF